MRPHEHAIRESLGINRYASLAALIAREGRHLRPAPLPAGVLVAADLAASRLIGPLGSIACSRPLMRSLAALADGERPVEELVAAGRWEDEVALAAAADAFCLKLMAVGLRLVRGENWQIERLKSSV